MITAVWKRETASLYKNIDPQKVAEEITALGDAVTPDDVLEMAKNEECETHKCFTWDDTVAAYKWRKHEARQIFCNLVIQQVEQKSEEMVPIRVFHKNDCGGYKRAELVFRVQDEYEKLLQCAMAELKRFKEKYSSLQELDYILQLIE